MQVHGIAAEFAWDELEVPEGSVVVGDPPRQGLFPDVLKQIAGCGPARIVYLSCDPATLARDLKRFRNCGFELKQVQGFDLFPQTPHVEAVASPWFENDVNFPLDEWVFVSFTRNPTTGYSELRMNGHLVGEQPNIAGVRVFGGSSVTLRLNGPAVGWLGLYDKALAHREEHTREIDTREEFMEWFTAPDGEPTPIHAGFAMTHFCGDRDLEEQIKAELGVTVLCEPIDGDPEPGTCPFSGKPSPRRVVWGKSY